MLQHISIVPQVKAVVHALHSMRAFSNLVNVGGPMDMFLSKLCIYISGSCGVSASTTSALLDDFDLFLQVVRLAATSVSVPPLSIRLRYHVIRDFARPESMAGVASTRVVLRTVVEKPVTTMAYNGMLCLYVLAARCFYYIRL